MVRLRGQKLVRLSELGKGETSFPQDQVTPAGKRLTQNSELPTRERKKICKESEPHVRLPQNKKLLWGSSSSRSELVEVELPPPLLLRLRYINPIKNQLLLLPPIMQQGYAAAALNVKKALISTLTTTTSLDNNFDVESMIEIANGAFDSLASLHADYSDLYDAVRNFILSHCQLSEANKELERNRSCLLNMEAHHGYLFDLSDKALKALLGAQILVRVTENNVTPIATQIVETRRLLKELEEKLKQGNKEVDALQQECGILEKSFEAAEAEEKFAAEQIQEHKIKILEPINNRCHKAMDDIERTKVLLSSMSKFTCDCS